MATWLFLDHDLLCIAASLRKFSRAQGHPLSLSHSYIPEPVSIVWAGMSHTYPHHSPSKPQTQKTQLFSLWHISFQPRNLSAHMTAVTSTGLTTLTCKFPFASIVLIDERHKNLLRQAGTPVSQQELKDDDVADDSITVCAIFATVRPF